MQASLWIPMSLPPISNAKLFLTKAATIPHTKSSGATSSSRSAASRHMTSAPSSPAHAADHCLIRCAPLYLVGCAHAYARRRQWRRAARASSRTTRGCCAGPAGRASAGAAAPWCALFINLARRRDRRARLADLLAAANGSLLERLERVDAVDGRQLSFDDPLVELAVDAPALQRARAASQLGVHTIVHEGGELLHFDDHLTLGGVACALSHRMALERLVVHPTAEWALVLEDDVCAAVPHADQAIHRLLRRLPDNWDALFLGYHDARGRPHPTAQAAVGSAASASVPDAASVAVMPLRQPLFGLYAWVVRKAAAEALLENVFPIRGQVDYAISRWLVCERGRSYAVDPSGMLFFSPKSEVAGDTDIQTMTTLGAMLESHGSLESHRHHNDGAGEG